MENTNFPNGFPAGVTIRGATILNTYSGELFWVDSNAPLASESGPGTRENPFSTVDAAISNGCVANRGDVLLVAAGHSETFSAAAACALDVAGVQVIGLGTGNNKPKFTFSTSTAASMTLSANSIKLINVLGIAGIDGLLNPFNITGDDLELDIEWQDPTSLIEAARAILATGSDRVQCTLVYRGQILGNANVNGIRLVGCTAWNINANFYGLASTAWIQFITTACSNITVNGYMYNSGTINFTKDIIDTITGSTWFSSFYDGSFGGNVSGGSASALASDDVSTLASNMTVPSVDSTTNTLQRDVIGNKTDASVYVPGTTKSIEAYVKGHSDLQERVAFKIAATITNGQTLFTIAGGPIQILALVSIAVTANDATASTVQYSVTPTSGAAQTISAASSSIASASAGASITLAGTALSTAALYNANGPNLIASPGTVIAPVGIITAVVAVGSTTGTWAHYLRYKPLATGVTVS